MKSGGKVKKKAKGLRLTDTAVRFAVRALLKKAYVLARCGNIMRRYYKKGGSVKDACYHKVKSQYKVFPSAYASGAIAKCRKKKAGK